MSELNIVDENDNIIGEETRRNIHENNLIHREIAVWVFNDNHEILLQKRSMRKERHPGLWSASCAGNVEISDSYEGAALRELEEETGIKAAKEDLIFLEKLKKGDFSVKFQPGNSHFKAVYAYRFNGKLSDLRLDEGESTSLKFWPIDKILSLADEEKREFVPSLVNDEKYLDMYRKIKSLIG
ncbi:MAG: NUDIX domain-containing protein [Candidatus Moranbacteria bacterium]|nr:NUDIX domain-containing protein [Candidatus Moranbacteria bacterium]